MPTVVITPPSSNANAAPTSVPVQAEATTVMPTVQVAFRHKVKREIRRYGVEQAMNRWRVICDYLQTEDWWPAVVREVETAFDEAFDERNRLQAELNSRQAPSPLQLTISQQQGDVGTNNIFDKESGCQVFNGHVTGKFLK